MTVSSPNSTPSADRGSEGMRLFVLKLLGYTALLLALVLGLFGATAHWARQSEPMRLPDGTASVVLGHSHAECSFMDSLAPGFVNLAQSGESYFYSFQKLKGLLENNPNLKQVLVEFTNNQIDAEMDAWIWSDKYLEHRVPMYAPYLSSRDASVLMQRNLPCFLVAGVTSIKQNVLTRMDAGSGSIQTYGGYLGLRKSLGSDTARFEAVDLGLAGGDGQAAEGGHAGPPISHTNIAYLEKMRDLCAERGVAFSLLRSPQHPDYALSNEAAYRRVLQERFAEVPHYDFGQWPLPDTLFADLEHLNVDGSARFTRHLMERLDRQAVALR